MAWIVQRRRSNEGRNGFVFQNVIEMKSLKIKSCSLQHFVLSGIKFFSTLCQVLWIMWFCGHWQYSLAVVQEKAVCCVRNTEWCGIDTFSHNSEEEFCWKRQFCVACGISDSIVETLVLCVCQESSRKINYQIRSFLWQRKRVMYTLGSEEIVDGAIVLPILSQEDHVSSFTWIELILCSIA